MNGPQNPTSGLAKAMTNRPSSKAREARYRRLIRALNTACDAMESIVLHEPLECRPDDGRRRLKRDMAEYADFLESATWWRIR